MPLIDQLRSIAERIPNQLPHIQTEEATKTSLILPFINALGYNIFDPTEVKPEFIADVGIKKGEKVDYAIFRDNNPIIIFECKTHTVDLDNVHASQLFRYFTTLKTTRIAILTNGLTYRLFSDLDSENRMDDRPFLEFNIIDVDERVASQLEKLSKSQFDLPTLLAAANELKAIKGIKDKLVEQFSSPSPDFVRFFASGKRMTEGVIEQYSNLVKTALTQFISERVSDRLKSALARETAVIDRVALPPQDEPDSEAPSDDGVETTEIELQAYYIVKAILGEAVDIERVTMRDAKSYFSVLLDNNNRKPICRLHTQTKNMYLGLFDEGKREERVKLESLSDIYKHAKKLKETAIRYDKHPEPSDSLEDEGAESE